MNAPDLHSALKSLALRKNCPLDHVSLYEDFFSGIGFIRTLEHLLKRNELPFQLKTRCAWEFSLLASKKHLEEAARIAACADLIVISKSKTGPVPQTVVRWFDELSGLRHDREGVLLALADQEASTLEDLKYFQERAKRVGLEFFVEKIESRSKLNGNTGASDSELEWAAFKTLTQTPSFPPGVEHWGINEY
jgi:hypothetical protein